MKNVFLLSVALLISCLMLKAQKVLPDDATLEDFFGMSAQEYLNKVGRHVKLGDTYYAINDFKDAKKAYEKASRSKDIDEMLLGAYRLQELTEINGSKKGEGIGAALLGTSAYSNAYTEAVIKKCLKKRGTPDLSRDEFYAQKSILTLKQMTLQANNKVPQPQEQSQQTEQLQMAANQPVTQPTIQPAVQPTIPNTASKADVDMNIPITNKSSSENTFVVIIANENYQEVAKVPYTINDGEIFAEYCKKTLGIPETNISLVKDATANNMKREIRWLTQILEQFKGEAKAIIYYAGHGIPDESTKDSYLLPVDGYGDDPTTGYSLNELYKTLNSVPSQSTLVFLDACFSGAQRDGGMLASARGIAIKAKPTAPVGNMIVFSAAQGDETAYPYKEKNHGLFTYYLLKKLQETEGNITLGELGDYITDQVSKKSIIVNHKSQTPMVSVSSAMQGDWKGLKLK